MSGPSPRSIPRSLLAAVVAGVVVAAVTTSSASSAPAAAEPFHVARAFTVSAEAYPMEPSPGTQDTALAVRPSSTKAVTTNPPTSAFARAAASDLGLAEAYVGQQGPAVAADTATENDPEDAVHDEGGLHLEVHVREDPTSLAIAVGNGDGSADSPSGSFASRSESIGDGQILVATAEAEANDVVLGPFVLGSGRYDAEAHLDGTVKGSGGSGTITTSDATLGGVPIVIDDTGFRIDESKVPDPLLDEATATIQELFSPGGYADIRVVQPKVEVAEDGSSVRVSGGGVHVFFTNNDPAERYFVGYTMLGGDVQASLGGVLARPTPSFTPDTVPPPSTGAPPTGAAGPSAGVGSSPSGATVTPPGQATPEQLAAEIAYSDGREVLHLRSIWPGLRWIILATILGWLIVGALHTPWLASSRRSIRVQLDDFSDRYTRG